MFDEIKAVYNAISDFLEDSDNDYESALVATHASLEDILNKYGKKVKDAARTSTVSDAS